ncbi:hypothetical protein QBC38DRAFT_456759 [Podospora fimiseda]|uniref:Uncharacterized protein n=1 Tax=Podospora fimiseda TaxID=252190 RepID=A0AAN7BMC6_9PEZI|nr:hypothetical protein QBC38DRAFT_456759 [Podospora fimiseda]
MDSVTPSSTGGPSWQIDIPSLTSLITRAGARGLQQLVQFGVDVHTIGCILTLGEITPACDLFRRFMLEKRAAQRKQTWFIHGLVEFGAGTNFVSLTSQTLSKLFEEVHAPAHGTPSYGQLQAIRSVAIPLARALDFKDHMAKFHAWICNQFNHHFSVHSPFHCHGVEQSIPNTAIIVSVLLGLKSVLLESATASRRLIFKGIPGAAWLLAYESKIF